MTPTHLALNKSEFSFKSFSTGSLRKGLNKALKYEYSNEDFLIGRFHLNSVQKSHFEKLTCQVRICSIDRKRECDLTITEENCPMKNSGYNFTLF